MSAPPPDGRRYAERIRRNGHFYLFISPFFVLFAAFALYPIVFSFLLSFTEWDGFVPIKWVGLDNLRLAAHDEAFWNSLWNTLVICVLYIPPMLVAAFLLAVLLNATWLKFRSLYRAVFFLPVITPMVAIALVFGLLYDTDRGLLNATLAAIEEAAPWLGLRPLPWLTSETWSKPSIAILLIWRWAGYGMVLMLAGLQGIPRTYYESARIDGAGAWSRAWHITLPLMRPVFIFCAITSLVGTIYAFDEVFMLTYGGPGRSSTNFGLYLFNTSFDDFRFGYASCLAYGVAAVVFIASLFILRFRRSDWN